MAQYRLKDPTSQLGCDQKAAASNPKPESGVASLSDRNTEEYPYETQEFHRCWRTFLAPKFDNSFYDQDILVFRKPVFNRLLKLHELHISGWNCAWSQDLTPERTMTLESVFKKVKWDCFRMTWSESRRPLQTFESLSAKGYPLVQRFLPPQYIADLKNGFDVYLRSLSHNGRTNLRKKVRRAQTMSPHLVTVDGFSEIDGFFETFFRHHIAYWDAKIGYSYLNDPHEQDFILNWAKNLHRTRNLVLHKVLLNGEVVNLGVGIVFGQTYYWLLAINTGLYNEYVPGIIALYLRIQHAAERGITQLNMGQGDYFYKIQSASKVENCYELIVCNPASWKGRAYYHWLQRKLTKTDSAM